MGPLFYYELVRLARKGRSTLLRCAYAVAVFGALYYAYRQRFPRQDLWDALIASRPVVPVPEMARLAEGFVYAILGVQTAAVFLLTPVYVADAVVGEKERRTLELLLTTRLRDREIVLGKLAAGLAHLGGILLAGLPLLAMTQLWGGVDIVALLLAFAATGLNLFFIGALCAYVSTQTRTVAGAMAACYAVAVPSWLCCLAFGIVSPADVFVILSAPFLPMLYRPTNPALYMSLVLWGLQFLVALSVALRAGSHLRRGPTVTCGEPAAGERGATRLAGAAVEEGVKPEVLATVPPVGNFPLFWKEVYQGSKDVFSRELEGGLRRTWRWLFVVLFVGALWVWTGRSATKDFPILDLARVALVLAAAVWCVGTAFRAAGSVSLERDRRTLDVLLTLPSGRTALLGAKWLGSVLRWRLAGYLLATAIFIGRFNNGLDTLTLAELLVSVAAWLAFWASAGVWLSVVCPTALRARVTTAAAVLLVFGGTWFVLVHDARYEQFGFWGLYGAGTWWDAVRAAVRDVGVNPLRAWWFLAWGQVAAEGNSWVYSARLTGAACGAGGCVVLSALLLLDAWRRFRREGSR